MKKNLRIISTILVFGLLLMTLVSFYPHPYHVGSVEFNYNQKTKTFEITGKFFMDDLENAVNKKLDKSLHFQNTNQAKEMNTALQKYALEYIKLKTNNQTNNIQYIGYEEDKESVEIYLESSKVENPKKVETSISCLYNLFDDQMNIIHIIVGGKRKSAKLNYPDKVITQQF